jgi:hypothetical protein
MTLRIILSQFWNNVQYKLFPQLEEDLGELSEKHKKLISVLEFTRIEEFIPSHSGYVGRPCKDRKKIARALIAKVIFKLPYTNQLIEYLKSDKQLRMICGWDSARSIPHESKFSRAFKEFAELKLAEKAHQAMIADCYREEVVFHVVKDSTPIEVREKATKIEKEEKTKKMQGRPKKGEEKKKEPNRRQRQLDGGLTLDQMIGELPNNCSIGMKKNAKGHALIWKGYKVHAAIDDNCIPLAIIVSAASLNDCEVAIPLAEKSNLVARNFYDLMDAAYSHPEIKEHSRRLGHVPIIDICPSGVKEKEEKELERSRKKLINHQTAEDNRYNERSKAERFNALYKDYYGGRTIRYRGHEKVASDVFFGVLSLAATLLLNLGN